MGCCAARPPSITCSKPQTLFHVFAGWETVPPHHPSLRRTLTPAICLPSILQLKRRQTHLTKIKWWEKYSHLFVWCVFYVQREARLFSLAAVEGGRRGRKGGERGKKTPSVMRFVFLFRPGSSGISRNKRKMPLKKKGFHTQTAIPNTPPLFPKVHQGTPTLSSIHPW